MKYKVVIKCPFCNSYRKVHPARWSKAANQEMRTKIPYLVRCSDCEEILSLVRDSIIEKDI
jgi:hypothetical protein